MTSNTREQDSARVPSRRARGVLLVLAAGAATTVGCTALEPCFPTALHCSNTDRPSFGTRVGLSVVSTSRIGVLVLHIDGPRPVEFVADSGVSAAMEPDIEHGGIRVLLLGATSPNGSLGWLQYAAPVAMTPSARILEATSDRSEEYRLLADEEVRVSLAVRR